MSRNFAESGISSIGPLPWGTHICQFYEDASDLRDALADYVRAGLDQGQACLLVAAEPLAADAAVAALRAEFPGLQRLLKSGQMEIVDGREWYLAEARFDPDRVLASWAARTEAAIARGFDGLRVAANAFWVDNPQTFHTFTNYETCLNTAMRDRRMVCLCSYPLVTARARDMLDVVRCHEFALTRREGEWEMVESATTKIAKDRLQRANEALEGKVAERTAHLGRALADKEVLLKEVHHRVKNNLQMVMSLLLLKRKELAARGCGHLVDEVLRRIHAIGLVHETLYLKDDNHRINFSDYLADLAKSLVTSFAMEEQVEVRVASEGGWVSLNQAIPLSLIATEVVTNALKHGFPDGRSGAIELAFHDLGPRGSLLEIKDTGIGLPPGQTAAPAGLGLGLVHKLAAQLDGRPTFDSRAGTAFALRIPKPEPERERAGGGT